MIRVAVCSAAWSVSVFSRLSFILHEVLSCLATVHYFFQHLARFFSSSRRASASVSLFISAESCFYQLAPDHCSTAGLDT